MMNNEKQSPLEKGHKSGFFAILGPTNSGKSTLLNKVIGKRVSIVSSKPQTTLRSVKGVLNNQSFQFVFVDTPGLHQRQETLMRKLKDVVERDASECDQVIWVFDASKKSALAQVQALKSSIQEKGKTICLLNKIDKLSKPMLLPLIKALVELDLFSQIIPVSAKTGDGLDRFVECVKSVSAEGERFYDPSQHTDRDDAFIVSEFVREKIYELTHQEIPYAVLVQVLSIDSSAKVPVIEVSISVDSASQKGILIGAKGSMLKSIGIRARKAVEQHFGKKVCLKLRVEVKSGWREDRNLIEEYLELR